MWVIFLYHAPHEVTGSKNSFLYHDQGHAACEPDLSQHECKCSSIFYISSDDVDTPLCCASPTKIFLEMSLLLYKLHLV